MEAINDNESSVSSGRTNKHIIKMGLCPCCGNEKDLGKSISKIPLSIALCAHLPLGAEFQMAKIGFTKNTKIRACDTCYKTSVRATSWANDNYTVPLFQKPIGKVFYGELVVVERPFKIVRNTEEFTLVITTSLLTYHPFYCD
jgi:hypothetical protein